MSYSYLNFTDNPNKGSRNSKDVYKTFLLDQYENAKKILNKALRFINPDKDRPQYSSEGENMSYLCLNFVDNLNDGSRNPMDVYKTSLSDQYEHVKEKLNLDEGVSFQRFVESVLPSNIRKKYYISMPGFDRSPNPVMKKDGSWAGDVINNIVIRPENDVFSRDFIPEGYDIIFVGDICLFKVVTVRIKGFDIMDSAIVKFGEKEVECIAKSAFSKLTLSTGATVPDFNTTDLRDTVLTNDFVDSLCNEVFPIPDPRKAMDIFDKWEKYLEFREYYLNKKSEKTEPIAGITVCDSYMIPKKAYNKELLHDFLLDESEKFAKSDQVILSRKTDSSDADPFPLIRIDIEKNRKELLQNMIPGRKRSEYEGKLMMFTHDSMSVIDKNAPKANSRDGRFSLNSKQILLGDRYLFDYKDLEPDCTDIRVREEKQKAEEKRRIDNKYEGIINDIVQKYIAEETSRIEDNNNGKLEEYRERLSKSFEEDVAANNDKKVAKAYNDAVDDELHAAEKWFKNERKKLKKINPKKTDRLDEERRINKEYAEKQAAARNKYILDDFYIERNKRLIEKKELDLKTAAKNEIEELKRNKFNNLRAEYRPDREREIGDAESVLKQKADEEEAERINNETIRQFRIYFRPFDTDAGAGSLKKDFAETENKCLAYDPRAEQAKIERQRKALQSLNEGYVRNPYLASYLFAPESLRQTKRQSNADIEWYLDNNEMQKDAVRKALVSDSIFLLQGPPGTGKTQVIAEMTAQFVKQGKKVLISSETHKAIDNVFERLPKIPEIRPLRMIADYSGKETNYSPEKLVDNFYLNIGDTLDKKIEKFENYTEHREKFWDQIKQFRMDYGKLLILKQNVSDKETQRKTLNKGILKCNKKIDEIGKNLSDINNELDQCEKTIRNINNNRFETEGTREHLIEEYKNACETILHSYECFEGLPISMISILLEADPAVIENEIDLLTADDKTMRLQRRKSELRAELSALRNPDTDDAPQPGEANFDAYASKQKELFSIVRELNDTKNESIPSEDMLIPNIVSADTIADKNKLKNIPGNISSLKQRLLESGAEITGRIERETEALEKKKSTIQKKINDIKIARTELIQKSDEISDDEEVVEYEELNSGLKREINKFLHDFDIDKEYDPDNMESAIDLVENEWKALQDDFSQKQRENETRIPMYREITRYLKNPDILEEDRLAYTRDLFQNVNVFGTTCTSRDSFTGEQIEDLRKYQIERIDIKEQGIDVVIIDEVSKSSFLDLLIPILNGKTVILTGDHRQLPPMYDLRHLRDEDFEELDEAYVTKEKNKRYTDLYEECFFKTLYENVPSDFRIMLNKQYRCHGDIMDVFNHFYGGYANGLKLGKPQQNDEKQHDLTVAVNGKKLIDPSRHIYFVNCEEKETRNEGSTSIINNQEAEVAACLVRKLNDAAIKLGQTRHFKIDKERQRDERPSIGVICTYRDQARQIKRKLGSTQLTGFSRKDDERLIINTVDDFQGDERDIIIVSMVRNPRGRNYDLEFIKKFERINVSLSRARKLLIIVGARDFLSREGIIDLPDLEGRKNLDKRNFPVFKEIIDTIEYRGRIIESGEILEDSYGK